MNLHNWSISKLHIFLSLHKVKNISHLSKIVDMTYSHVLLRVKELESDKLITLNKQGRERKIQLTKQGEIKQTHLLKGFK